ncbi:MAG: saccharopine dehydrogenase NADP-binding domain-containing protein [Candidatus Thermoplasmatota archaeon]|nr:saccharopine dehydrogenase NADP-binding domain-containing protein [Candidatus Thermoplasmatota archaeon]
MSGNRIMLLGLGMQGKATLYDLVKSDLVSDILVVDRSSDLEDYIQSLNSDKVQAIRLDVQDSEKLSDLMGEVDLVIELLPPGFSFQIAKLAVQNNVSLVSTMYLQDPQDTNLEKIKAREKALAELDKKAKEKGIVILPQFGLDPGLDLVLAKQAVRELDEVDELYCYGAGLPEYDDADNPLKYKFTWSVEGLLKTYKRPARILKNGEVVDIPGDEIFSEENVHTLDLEKFEGLLECYPNGDALKYAERLDVKEDLESMGRYTCRWEGHTDFWEIMVKCRFLDEEPVEVGGKKVSPIRFVANHLQAQDNFWLKDDERDMAMIRVEAHGIKDGKRVRRVYQLIDRRDLQTGFTAMQRTVGFTASIGAHLILEGKIKGDGILSPTDIHLSEVSKELKNRDIDIDSHIENRTSH